MDKIKDLPPPPSIRQRGTPRDCDLPENRFNPILAVYSDNKRELQVQKQEHEVSITGLNIAKVEHT